MSAPAKSSPQPPKTAPVAPPSEPVDVEQLHSAVRVGNRERVSALLDEGISASAEDRHGVKPLCYVAYEGFKEIAALLLDKGANISAKDKQGKTPLDLAVNPDVIALLQPKA